ncbi:MAG: N-acetylmuramoyl-L-alanine amidase [Syntrophaceae bacterium]
MNYRFIRLFLIVLILIVFPYSEAMAQRPQGKHIVIIDAAHGGTDFGVQLTSKEHEKNVTLAIALLIKKELDKSGNIQANLTRTADIDVSLSERKNVISAARSEIFVSIHVNAGFSKNSTGYELYFPGFKSTKEDKSDSKAIIRDMTRNKYLNESVKLARLIEKNMGGVFPRKSRDLRNAPITVLEGVSIPAVVLEIGFATNADDRKKMLEENTQSAIAHALSQSIKDFF